MKWIFDEIYLENNKVLFIISVIILIVMAIIPFIIARNIFKKEK